jgi:hypothetical protein
LNGFAAVGDGGGQARAKEGFVERFDLVREETESDLGGGAEMGGTEGDTAVIEDGDGVPGAGIFGAVHVGGVNPDMTGGEPLGGAALNTERRTLHVLLV